MKILQVSSVIETVPPEKYGGVERIVYILCQELVKLGHQVTLLAPAGSKTNATLIANAKKGEFNGLLEGQRLEHKIKAEENLLTKTIELADSFDIIHCHFGPDVDSFYKLIKHCNDKVFFTLHGTLSWFRDDLKKYLGQLYLEDVNYQKAHYVSISNSQRQPAPGLNYLATVYNGTYFEGLDLVTNPTGDYLFFAGWTSFHKGIDLVVKVGEKLNQPVVLVGKVNDRDFFKKTVAPFIDNKLIKFFDSDSKVNIKEYFGQAKVFLFPIRWEEPFGLVMIEAMARGTPVVAFANGSVPEVVKDGVTGFIVNESEHKIKGNYLVKETGLVGLANAIARIYAMDNREYIAMRRRCRAHVEEYFSASLMTQNYLAVYKKLLNS